ncbi:MAG: amidohydrolase family protein [Bryobacteraceae bacterium]
MHNGAIDTIGITLERLVPPGKITLMRMIELFSTGPARVLNLNRGRLAVGSPADVTLFDTERSWTYDVNRSASKSRNSPFDGHIFRGGPVAAIVNGKVV